MSPQCHMARLRTILLLKSFPNECVLMSIHMCCGNPKVRAQKKPTRCASSCRAAGAIATATTVAPYLPKDSNHFRLNGGLQPGRTGSKWTILIVFSGLESGAAAHNKLGEFLTLAYLCLGSKLFGVQTVSALICSRSMLFRCGLAHDTSIFDIVHDS